jgi:Fe-S cluster assembly iron-binding protein IscA
MSITVTQNVTEVDITIEHNGISIEVQPVITKNLRDSDIDGGTP